MSNKGWDYLSPEILDIIKVFLDQPEDGNCCLTERAKKLLIMKDLRLVNWHWSLWATRAITMLRPPTCDLSLQEQLERIAKKFINLNTLQLQRIADYQYLNRGFKHYEITDDDLRCLSLLPNLTCLELCPSQGLTSFPSFNHGVTDVGMSYLGNLRALKSLDLGACGRVTDVGVQHLMPLGSLTKLALYGRNTITGIGARYLESFVGLRDLDLSGNVGISNVEVQYLGSLTSLTRLWLCWCFEITDKGVECLRSLITLRDLKLDHCWKITDVGVVHLAALTSLTRLSLWECRKITDNGMSYMQSLASLTDLDLCLCDQLTDVSIGYLEALTSLRALHLGGCGKVTEDGIRHLKSLPSFADLKIRFSGKYLDYWEISVMQPIFYQRHQVGMRQ